MLQTDHGPNYHHWCTGRVSSACDLHSWTLINTASGLPTAGCRMRPINPIEHAIITIHESPLLQLEQAGCCLDEHVAQ